MDENERQEELERILEELATSQNILQNKLDQYISRIVTVYSDPDFRHMYSRFYAKITFIDGSDEGNLEILSQNIRILYEEIYRRFREENSNITIKVYNGVRKLHDHINLDIARINYIRTISNRAEAIQKEVEETQNNVEKTQKEVRETQEQTQFTFDELKKEVMSTKKQSVAILQRVQKAEREYIAILGIFAAIIAAFFSGIGFSTSILANIEKATIYRLSGMTTLVGLIIFNILVLLMSFVSHIVEVKFELNPDFVSKINKLFLAILIVIIIGWVFNVTAIRSIWVQSIIKYFSGT